MYTLRCYTIGIPCNTAHISPIHEEIDNLLQKNSITDINFFHMIEELAYYLIQNNINTVGLLATKGTYASQLYENVLRKYNIELPYNEEKRELVHESIYNPKYGIKSYSFPPSKEASTILRDSAQELCNNHGVQAIIMGCTEIPIALSQNMLDGLLIDATDVLAKVLVRHSNPDKLLSI